MVGSLETTPTEPAEVPTTAKSLTAIRPRLVLLVLRGGTFDPGLTYTAGLTMAAEKMERVLDDVRVRVGRARRSPSPDTPAE